MINKEEESFVLLPQRQPHWLGANELHHALGGPPQVRVEVHRGVAQYGPAREQLRRVE